MRLNKRLAPDLYLDVVAITGSYDKPSVDGHGNVFEWAVKIIQFNPEHQFDRLLLKGLLEQQHIISIAEEITSFHDSLPHSNATSTYGDADNTYTHVRDNYIQAKKFNHPTDISEKLEHLSRWHEKQFNTLKDLLNDRKTNGFIRECHGDLHLGNIALHKNKVIMFDCLEFDEGLRQIDIINEVSFLLMDLEANNQKTFSNHFINHWLQICGDFEGLRLLNFYKTYRAMVRTKVAIITANQKQEKTTNTDFERINLYLNLAMRYTRRPECAIIITHGLSGSGKSTISRQLASHINAIYVRSDVERKRLLNSQQKNIYNTEANKKTYHRLEIACEAIIEAGYNALIDATFLNSNKRHDFLSLSARLHIPCIILDFFAPIELLEKWLVERSREGHDASDADIAILNQQIKERSPLTNHEKGISIRINTSQEVDIKSLEEQIKSKIHAFYESL